MLAPARDDILAVSRDDQTIGQKQICRLVNQGVAAINTSQNFQTTGGFAVDLDGVLQAMNSLDIVTAVMEMKGKGATIFADKRDAHRTCRNRRF
ncbi:hypothetical protein COW83_00750 [Candidatus Collierbacteria bacterium CG22_combo_CG10-13_8_21_14_all_43_12]|uniref:Uncharacterized protein n=2 Tax=Candidatus Collieribacteriota TaxID=1752725 RepID=A0A2H0DVC8_9BACT|nr:MAG: hypothetical protein COW83_00750 [Candidatus Collierbacteria bacterium CG22_combo_CG10-13_8_21_14_all_43_12]PJB47985.1 MAG: hypothetical protein CO104_02375 [Candidatus Collierbacteria bacterium CG_4_9_14_3_um_filter_43_16]